MNRPANRLLWLLKWIEAAHPATGTPHHFCRWTDDTTHEDYFVLRVNGIAVILTNDDLERPIDDLIRLIGQELTNSENGPRTDVKRLDPPPIDPLPPTAVS